jgi:uncharacterized protein DUF4253
LLVQNQKPMLLAIAAAFWLHACTAKELPLLTPVETNLVAELHFDAELMRRVKSHGSGYLRLMAMTENGDEVPAEGIVLLTAPKEGDSVLRKVRRELAGTPYGAWLNDQAFGTGPDKIAILKSHDQYVYLALARTDGINFDLTHEKVVQRYREWASRYGLELDGAGLDWLSARITRPPTDWQAFAAEVYKFCPDIVDQGTGDVALLAREMQNQSTLYLWWD